MKLFEISTHIFDRYQTSKEIFGFLKILTDNYILWNVDHIQYWYLSSWLLEYGLEQFFEFLPFDTRITSSEAEPGRYKSIQQKRRVWQIESTGKVTKIKTELI